MSEELFRKTLASFTTIVDDKLLLENGYMRLITPEESNYEVRDYLYYRVYKDFTFNDEHLRQGNIIAIKHNGNLHIKPTKQMDVS